MQRVAAIGDCARSRESSQRLILGDTATPCGVEAAAPASSEDCPICNVLYWINVRSA